MSKQKWDLIIDNEKPSLYYRLYIPEKEIKNYVLLIPGYTGHCDVHYELCDELSDNNICVMALNLRGHGMSSGYRFSVKSFDDYCDDINRAILRFKKELNLQENENFKINIIAHSHGALLSHYYKQKFDNKDMIKSLILVCPFYWNKILSNIFITNIAFYSMKILSKIIPNIKIKTGGIPENVNDNDQWILTAKNDILNIGDNLLKSSSGCFTPSWFVSSFEIQNFIINKTDIKIPILFIYANNDIVVDNEKIIEIFNKLKTNNQKTELVKFDGKHDLLRCNSRNIVFKYIINYINKL